MITAADIAKWKVLIVEDDADARFLMTYLLEFKGAVVHVAEHGEEALALLEEFFPDLIILDIAMPVMDGWETLKRIREINIFDQVPVIAVTAHAMKGDRERILEAGFDYYISKPFSPATVLDELVQALNQQTHVVAYLGAKR
ncbi:MAG: response regulator [Chloroflexi bacterium]|nr:response regulator [Chloroflexota bacterium]